MLNSVIRDAQKQDFSAIVELNQAEVAHTSVMDYKRLCQLDALAAYHRVVVVEGELVGFLFAMDDKAKYVNDNFRWFSEKLSNFYYIDRVVIAARFSGKGVGSSLYQDLLNYSQSRSIDYLVCEYNIDPPNPPSMNFHKKWGFTELGRQHLNGGAKQVSMQCLQLASRPPLISRAI